jgi:hypothetical protein
MRRFWHSSRRKVRSRMKFRLFYGDDLIGKFETLEDAQAVIYAHHDYKKSWYTKKGEPSSRHPAVRELRSKESRSFSIYDDRGYRWSIRAR